MTSPAYLAVLPGRPGKRGVGFASNERLTELLVRYQAIATSPESDSGLVRYAKSLIQEISTEQRRRHERAARQRPAANLGAVAA